MGDIIGIEEQLDPLRFRIRFFVTGEERVVVLDADKANLFFSQDTGEILPMACPFLRFPQPRQACCTVHETRPDLCRQYACFRILVLDPEGKILGKVPDRSHVLSTQDAGLREIWRREVAGTDIPGEAAWETHVEGVFSRAGYHVVR